jgi:hypothetical protein
MTVGKPNFNLNSFGVKYLSKEEIQDFLDKREGEKIGTKKELGDSKQLTSRGTTSGRTNVKPITPTSGIGHKAHPNLMGTPKNDMDSLTHSGGGMPVEPKGIPTKDTKTYFTTAKNPNQKENIHQRSFDSKETSGFVTQKVKPQWGKEGTEPSERPKVTPKKLGGRGQTITVGTKKKPRKIFSDTTTTQSKEDKKENEITIDDEKSTTKRGKKGKNLPSQIGNAPKKLTTANEKVLSTTEGITPKGTRSGSGGKTVRVGVGEKAHETFTDTSGEGEYEKTLSHKKTGEKATGRPKKGLNLNSENSRPVKNHNSRTGKNLSWYSKEQKDTYSKIDPKDRESQSKYHDEQDKLYNRSVTENKPREMSDAGKKLLAGIGKTNEIVRDMDILKLDINKNKETDTIDRNVKNIMSSNDHIDLLAGVNRLKPKKLKKSADETIFKAILLKLDLMKVHPKRDRKFIRELNSANRNEVGRHARKLTERQLDLKQSQVETALRNNPENQRVREKKLVNNP